MKSSPITSETLARMVNLSGEAIIFCDSDGKIRYCNGAASEMFHYEETKIVEMHFDDFFTIDENESVFELIKNIPLLGLGEKFISFVSFFAKVLTVVMYSFTVVFVTTAEL